jgi:hypothetical protein
MVEDPKSNAFTNGQQDHSDSQQAPEIPPKPVKRGRGQPTKYRREYCDLLLKHFDSTPFRLGEIVKSGKNWSVHEDKLLPNPLPTLEGFAWILGINMDTLHEWRDKHPEFSAALARVKLKQKEILVQGGLAGTYESRFAQFVAINFTDMRQKIEIDGTFSAGERLTDEKVRQIAQEAARQQLRGVVDVPKIAAKVEEG